MGPLDPAGNTGNCQVYNNTFYIKKGLTSIWSTAHSNNGPVTIENNIFYFAGDTSVNATNWNPGITRHTATTCTTMYPIIQLMQMQ